MDGPNSPQAPQGRAGVRLKGRYDHLWSTARWQICSGKIQVDPVLASGRPDRRRGLTLIAGPSPNVRRRVAAFLAELEEVEPGQYYYKPAEFHLTILSLFTATAHCRRFFRQLDGYVAAVDLALRKTSPIRIEFVGITASPSAIMIQGFFENEALNDLREALRRQLRAGGLAEGLDRRYRLETAHMTVARFRAPLRNGERLTTALDRARHRPFGSTKIARLRLVKNDWYMTNQLLEAVKIYRLPRVH